MLEEELLTLPIFLEGDLVNVYPYQNSVYLPKQRDVIPKDL